MKPSLSLLLFVVGAVLPTLSVANSLGDVMRAVDLREPASISRKDRCTLWHFSAREGRWIAHRSPPLTKPTGTGFVAIGPTYAAIVDPDHRYSGWLFDSRSGSWTNFPDSPIRGPDRVYDPIVVAFLEDRLFVWGKCAGPPHGAILDTKTLKWAVLPEAPIGIRYRAPHAVIGKKVLIWGGYSNFHQDGAVFDVGTNSWEKMPEAPIRFVTNMVYTTWKERFVVFGGRSADMPDRGTRKGAIYDPAIKRWEEIEEAPLDIGIMSACAVAGDSLFLWSGQAGASEKASKGIPTDEGAVYDLITKKWRKIKAAPIQPRSLSFTCPLDKHRIAVWGGWTSKHPSGAQFHTDAAAYDLRSNTWSKLPDFPEEIPQTLHPGW